jgi:hypothetical protein
MLSMPPTHYGFKRSVILLKRKSEILKITVVKGRAVFKMNNSLVYDLNLACTDAFEMSAKGKSGLKWKRLLVVLYV